MKLTVLEKDSQTVVHGKEESLEWSFDVEVGVHIYRFSGTRAERKLLAFKNVSSYKKTLETLVVFLNEQFTRIKQKFGTDATIQNHNFLETCDHIRGPIRTLLPDLRGARNHDDKIGKVAQRLAQLSRKEIATVLLEVDRSITNLQTQITGLEIIAGDYDPTCLDQDLKHAIEAIVSPFRKNFKELAIQYFNNIPDGVTLNFDYQALNFAMYHVLNNAIKYCQPGTDLKIFYEVTPRRMIIEMISVKVQENEEKEIFTLGRRGVVASEHFSGEGLGMAFAEQSLKYIDATIIFQSNNSTCTPDDKDILRCKNNVIIYFK